VPQFRELFAAQAITLVGTALVGFYTAAVLGPAGKGIAAFAIGVASLGGAALFLSLHVATTAGYLQGDRGVIVRSLVIATAVGGIPLLVAWPLGEVGVGAASSEMQRALLVALVGIAVDAPTLVALRTLQGLGDAGRFRTGSFLRVAVNAALVLLFTSFGLTPVLVVSAFVCGDVVALFYGLVSLRQFTGRNPPVQETTSPPRRELFGRALAAHVALLGQQASYRADLVILGVLAPAAVVGKYAVGTSIAEIIWVLAEAVSLSLFARTARLAIGASREVLAVELARSLRFYAEVGSVAGLALVVVTYPVLRVFLPSYRGSFIYFLILLPGVLVGGQARIIISSAVAAGRQRLVRAVAFVSMSLVVVYVPLILVAGAVGAALASDLIYVTLVIVLMRLSRRLP
jgi:O-antigen/teichoic acid export membrane protein